MFAFVQYRQRTSDIRSACYDYLSTQGVVPRLVRARRIRSRLGYISDLLQLLMGGFGTGPTE